MSKAKTYAQAEKFFSRSWTHIFYFWKLRQVMLGNTVKNVLSDFADETPVRVVDLGCGPGTNLFDVQEVCREFDHVSWFGLDLNRKEVAEGAGRSNYRVAQRKMKPIHFMAGDIFRLPFPDRSIDILISSEVVEHLPDPQPAIAEMARVLKPGGYAMITTPNPQNLPESMGYLLDRLTMGWFKRFYWKGQDDVSAPPLSAEVGYGHVSVHPYPVWKEWLEASGLRVEKKVRGPMIFGSPFFDRQRWLSGLFIALDPLLDMLPGKFYTTTNLGMLCRKEER